MRIIEYTEDYAERVRELILHIQNDEAGINLTLEEQPDLLDVETYYLKGGGNGVLKKFFVRADRRGKGVGSALYETFYGFARESGFKRILLDTPSVAAASHRFYERAGFVGIDKERLPFEYDYPDRDSYLYLLEM